jgi:hypothetical protein
MAGFAAFLLGAAYMDPSYSLRAFNLASLLAYSFVGGLLVWNGRRDRRAVYLGVAFFLIASSSSDSLFVGLSQSRLAVLSAAAHVCFRLQPDAFLPVFLWLFFEEFPRRPSFRFASALPRRAALICAAAGFALSGLLAFETMFHFQGQIAGDGPLPTHNGPLHLYAWSLVLALSFPALFFAMWNTRAAPLEERRRVRLFLAGLGIGLVPNLVAMLLETFVPSFALLVQDPGARQVERFVLRTLLILVPVTTAYSVLVDRVLDVRLYLRRAIQYALTRYALLTAATVPFLLLVAYVYLHRGQTVTELLSGSRLILALVGTAGLLGLRIRSRAGRLIDRHFFREQYDSRRILAELVAKSREVRTPEEMAKLLGSELDRALHLGSTAIISRVEGTGELRSPGGVTRPLETTSTLAKLLAGSPEPMEVDLESRGGALERLSREEREWIADGDFCLLVPLLASDGSLVGLIALGEKKSELPFSREDRLLLTAIAAAAALTLENRLLLSTPAQARERTGPIASATKSAPPATLHPGAAVE